MPKHDFDLEGLKASEADIIEEYVTQKDYKNISEILKPANLAISVRKTGGYSLARLNAGSGAKPHDILEKSIKDEQLVSNYDFDQIKGFIGHWSINKDVGANKLLGIYLTDWGYDNLVEDYGDYIRDVVPKVNKEVVRPRYYLSFTDKTEDLELDPSTKEWRIKAQRSVEIFDHSKLPDLGANWEKNFFTGDYDMHDIFYTTTPMTYGFYEAAHVKSKIDEINNRHLEEFNSEITGVARREDYKCIQHGPQISYIAHMLEKEMNMLREGSEKIVRSVANPGFPIALCYDKSWYIFTNITEYKGFISAYGSAVKCTWDDMTKMTEFLGRISDKFNIIVK